MTPNNFMAKRLSVVGVLGSAGLIALGVGCATDEKQESEHEKLSRLKAQVAAYCGAVKTLNDEWYDAVINKKVSADSSLRISMRKNDYETRCELATRDLERFMR
jgi:hypothetical protein